MQLYIVQVLVAEKDTHRLVSAVCDVILAGSDHIAVTDFMTRMMRAMAQQYDGEYPYVIVPSLVREVHPGIITAAYIGSLATQMKALEANATVLASRPEYQYCPVCGGNHKYSECPVLLQMNLGLNPDKLNRGDNSGYTGSNDTGGPTAPPDPFKDFFSGLDGLDGDDDDGIL
jgi:hypothetical protein